MSLPPIKTGQTLVFDGQLTLDGDPVDITGYEIMMDIRHGGETVAQSSVSITDAAAGEFTVDAGPTGDWSPGIYYFDLRYEYGGVTQYTETDSFHVLQPVTAGS